MNLFYLQFALKFLNLLNLNNHLYLLLYLLVGYYDELYFFDEGDLLLKEDLKNKIEVEMLKIDDVDYLILNHLMIFLECIQKENISNLYLGLFLCKLIL